MVSKHKNQFLIAFQMLENIILEANDEIWNKKVGGHIFWQQILHALMGNYFWLRDNNDDFIEPFLDKKYYPELENDPENIMSKDELIDFKNDVKDRVSSYFDNKDDKWLYQPSKLYPKLANFEIIFMQIRHLMYHVGYCNSLLNENCIKKVEWIDYYG